MEKNIEQNSNVLDRFTRKCERRTKKALNRMRHYEDKLADKANAGVDKSIGKAETGAKGKTTVVTSETTNDIEKNRKKVSGRRSKKNVEKDSLRSKIAMSGSNIPDSISREGVNINGLRPSTQGLGKELLLDSLRLAYGFAQFAGETSPINSDKAMQSINNAQTQLDITKRVKSELHDQKEKWKADLKKHPEYKKWVDKMAKEEYYYTAQINEYRKVLRDPSLLNDKLMNILRSNPRWSDFLATLPTKAQESGKMQPKQLVQQMMQSQAAAIDPNVTDVIQDARKRGSELLDNLNEKASSIGNFDNAAEIPTFKPNPYKSKTVWERIDFGFNLQFDRKTFHLPSSGVAGIQLSFNFSQHWSVGSLVHYKFGMGEAKHIHFSNIGIGIGTFTNYTFWKGFGVQAGFERNWHQNLNPTENIHIDAGWTSSALIGLSEEYSINKKAKGTISILYDILYKKHMPQTNAIMWRMGWKL